LQNTQANHEKLKKYNEAISQIPVERLVFLDESGVNLAMTRSSARCTQNERAYCPRPDGCRKNISLIGAVKVSGFVALYPYDGPIYGERFLSYLDDELIPKLITGDVLVLDNLRVHHIKPVREKLQSKGIGLLYLPPYRPELNPIEEAWALVKSTFRTLEARTITAFIDALQSARNTVTQKKIAGFFAHAGIDLK